MTRVEKLKESRDSLSVKFLEFTRVTSKGKTPAFFEGEDEKYYSIRIDNIRPDIVWTGINCGGKENVLSMRSKIRQHETYKSRSCLFFIDSDFDENKELSGLYDLYITPCYSIENLYFTESAFARLLSAEFGINDACNEDSCFYACMEKYRDLKCQYLDAIKGFNYLVKEIRSIERSGSPTGRLNINNVSIDDLVGVELSGVLKKYNENSPRSIFPELPEDLQVSLNDSKEYFGGRCGEMWFRGKQNLEFYRIFLGRLKQDRCNKNGREIFKNKGNVKLQLTKANAISELSQYAETPQCLRDFLLSFQANSLAA
ncbi:DUF4435 domain-containing protein [Thalassolituus sp. LLYu03]|uniref:DUF4435 domain-containing protein n=1 Tax=Thalassolituus sp. LLYu03 TaxID=3421656 RepID=UPI003D29325E